MRDEEVGEGMRRIALGRAERALERLREAGRGDPEQAALAIHGARKDLKKLRTVLRLFRDGLDERLYEEQSECFRAAGRTLAASRDAEVKVQTLTALGDRFPDLEAGLLGAWRLALEREREEAAAGFDRATVTEATGLIEAGREAIGAWEVEELSWDLLGGGVREIYTRGRRAMRRAEADPGEENLHRWRKRAKDLWYALRIIDRAWPELLGATAGQAHDLAELLGDHHDLAVLRRDLVERAFPADGAGTLSAAIAGREEELGRAAFALGRRLYAEKPKPFHRRIDAYWRA
jgi:CHAD domain-containing protein